MEIWTRAIPISQMRWGILGDYEDPHPELTKITVADTGIFLFNRLLAIHETIENTILRAKGISVGTVDAYCDKKLAEGKMPDSSDEDSPIHDIHMFCDKIERMVAEYCGIDWNEYEKTLDKVLGIYIARFNPTDLTDEFEKDLMKIETTCFDENIQETWESKKELIEESDVALFAYDGDTIIGEAYCGSTGAGDMGADAETEQEKKDAQHLDDIFFKLKEENATYFMSFAVLPEYQGKGIGKELVDEMLKTCREDGYLYVYTHAEKGASAHIFGMNGGEFIEERKNWFDSGHDHWLYKIPLKKRIFFKE